MQKFIDFLNFKTFISPYALVVCYYVGALGVPIGSWFFALWIKRRYWLVSDIYEKSKETAVNFTPTKYRLLFYTLFILCFFCMEIMWRMMFEFLIAYLQIREALLSLAMH